MANLHLIKTLAENKKMPITELAERVGVSEQQIHLMVRTNSTKINTLEKIAKVLDVPVTYFFDQPSLQTNEKYEAKGKHGIVAKNIGSVDNRETKIVRESTTKIQQSETDISEEIILPAECPEQIKHHIEKLSMEVSMLKKLLEEKERFINHLLDKK